LLSVSFSPPPPFFYAPRSLGSQGGGKPPPTPPERFCSRNLRLRSGPGSGKVTRREPRSARRRRGGEMRRKRGRNRVRRVSQRVSVVYLASCADQSFCSRVATPFSVSSQQQHLSVVHLASCGDQSFCSRVATSFSVSSQHRPTPVRHVCGPAVRNVCVRFVNVRVRVVNVCGRVAAPLSGSSTIGRVCSVLDAPFCSRVATPRIQNRGFRWPNGHDFWANRKGGKMAPKIAALRAEKVPKRGQNPGLGWVHLECSFREGSADDNPVIRWLTARCSYHVANTLLLQYKPFLQTTFTSLPTRKSAISTNLEN